jgi:hypothetical protein
MSAPFLRLRPSRLVAFVSFAGLTVAATSAAHAQTFTNASSQIPQGNPFNNSATENVDFADADGDGDWDAIWADGGDSGNDQSRIWINNGSGTFTDQTSTLFPAVLSDGRDIDFVDLDHDGDQDIYVSNTSITVQQTNRWWINMGGIQGGTQGFYQDQTQARWVNIAVNNGTTSFSSISNGTKLATGGFIDWSCDCAFCDLDMDGDMDIVHTTYGGAFGGDVPSRLFLNNGLGFYEEFNPSHYQLTASTIGSNKPGLWCEGQHIHNSNNATGTSCDIADTPLGVELGDIDGDLDVDILQGARNEVPRIYRNNLVENGGVLAAFRDVSFAVLPAGWAPGGGHYENEFGDFDGDDDLDIYGLNWEAVSDSTFLNSGAGTFSSKVVLTGSSDDDNEGDFIDYDCDGDLDLFVANFSGQERMYRNSGAGNLNNLTSGVLPSDFSTSLGDDPCDVDDDGDYDIFVANDGGQANVFLKNGNGIADVTAPRLARLEQAPDRAPGAPPTAIRVQLYDNSPWPMASFDATNLEYSVNGGSFTPVPMRWSGGQMFRGEIPGAVVGTIDYRVRSTDEHGNVGTSGIKTYHSSGGCTGSPASYCTAKTTSNGCVPAIGSSGAPSASAGSGFAVNATQMINNKSCLLFYGSTGPASVPFQGGTLCVATPIRRTIGTSTGGNPPPNDCSGSPSIDMNAFAVGGLGGSPAAFLTVSGTTVYCQWWGRDPGFASPNNTQLSDGLQYTICP